MSTRPPEEDGAPPFEQDGESPAAPPIPSFDSLRGPRRPSAFDLLVPAQPPAAPEPARTAAARTAAARPPEYADLLHLGVRLARAVAGVPVRVAWWSVRLPVRTVHRLLGDHAEGPR
jgi:hypothetical protein